MDKRQEEQFDKIKARSIELGWTLLSNRYHDIKTPLSFICENDHNLEMNSRSFLRYKSNCKECLKDKRNSETYEVIKTKTVEMGWNLISEKYTDCQDKLEFICNNGHTVKKTWKSSCRVLKCPKCSLTEYGSAREDFFKLVETEGYILNDTYKTCDDKISLICPEGHDWLITPYQFKNRGSRCTVCSGRCKVDTKERFMRNLEEKGYKIVEGEFKTMTQHLLIECSQGHLMNVTPESVRRNNCKKCVNKSSELAQELFMKALEKEGYMLMSKYQDVREPVKIVCLKGHERIVSPGQFRQEPKCVICNRKCPDHIKDDYIKTIIDEGYTFYDEFVNTLTTSRLVCPNSHIWTTKPRHFKIGNRCPHCPRSESKGESAVRNILEKMGIEYLRQKRFNFLSGRKFDFYFLYNQKEHVIEFDGLQHFRYSKYFHESQLKFLERRGIDVIKTTLPIKNNVKVIRISHRDLNNAEDHILKGLESEGDYYFSNLTDYKYILKHLN